MNLLTSTTSVCLWQDVIKGAENRCSITLQEDLEQYLVALVMRYINQPDVVKKIFATAFLEALQLRERERSVSLQHVGDQCLIFAGLFPRAAEKRHVKIGYFVDLGRSAYGAISKSTDDLYGSLALKFVVLMDVLQSIQETELMPFEAYEQWSEVGSERAMAILKQYVNVVPFKKMVSRS